MIERMDVRGKSVLFISDTHIPFSHPDYIRFLTAIKEKYKPDEVIHIGDEVDYHVVSFHDSDQDGLSSGMELDKAIIEIGEGLHRLFPQMILMESNHGSLVYRKMKHHGIPIRALRPLEQLYETPQWKWKPSVLLKTAKGWVFVSHGMSSNAKKMVLEHGCSVVQGHFHSRFEIAWFRSQLRESFSMFLGCLADEASYAMAYNKPNLSKFIMGCGIIGRNGVPKLLKMHLGIDGRWTGKL